METNGIVILPIVANLTTPDYIVWMRLFESIPSAIAHKVSTRLNVEDSLEVSLLLWDTLIFQPIFTQGEEVIRATILLGCPPADKATITIMPKAGYYGFALTIAEIVLNADTLIPILIGEISNDFG
jgi:hypothetical protein